MRVLGSGDRVGSAYLAVLSVTTLIVVTGLAGVAALRAQRATAWSHGDTAKARVLARSAVELGLEEMRVNDGWRAAMSGGTWMDEVRVDGSSTVSVAVVDDVDGSLTDDGSEAARVVGVGHVNGSRQSLSVVLEASERGYRVLSRAVHAGGALRVIDSAVEAGAGVSSNASIEHDGTTYTSGEHVLAMDSGVVEGAIVGDPVPGLGDAVAALVPMATVIDYALLPDGALEGVVLSSTSNPYGAADADGVYLIDAGGDQFDVRNSVILATLVVVNAGPDSEIEDTVYWEPGGADLPSLVLGGALRFGMTDGALDGEDLLVTGGGDEDEETYDAGLNGLFFVTGSVWVEDFFDLEGALVSGGDAVLDADPFEVRAGRDMVAMPPLGFVGWYEMVPDRGTWSRLISE